MLAFFKLLVRFQFYRPSSRCGHLDFTPFQLICNQTEAGRKNSLVPCAMNVSIHYCYWKQGTWPRWWQRDKGIELYIRTRGRTGDASGTNATGPQRDTPAIMYARWIRSTHWSLCLLNANAMLFCQLTKWPHKHTLSNARLFNLENGHLRACRGAYISQCAL